MEKMDAADAEPRLVPRLTIAMSKYKKFTNQHRYTLFKTPVGEIIAELIWTNAILPFYETFMR